MCENPGTNSFISPPRDLHQETANGPFTSSCQAATCYYHFHQ